MTVETGQCTCGRGSVIPAPLGLGLSVIVSLRVDGGHWWGALPSTVDLTQVRRLGFPAVGFSLLLLTWIQRGRGKSTLSTVLQKGHKADYNSGGIPAYPCWEMDWPPAEGHCQCWMLHHPVGPPVCPPNCPLRPCGWCLPDPDYWLGH